MGLFNEILGDASEIASEEVQVEYEDLLLQDEQVEKTYKVIRDLFVFTNYRLILVDIKGLTGVKTEYLSIPYKNITSFSVETAGDFDLNAVLNIWIKDRGGVPLTITFSRQLNVYELQQVLAHYVLNA